MRRTLFVLIFALFAAVSAHAQAPGRITGTVTSTGGRLLPGATVTLVGTNQSVEVGSDGTYSIAVLPGTYNVQARLLGYSQTTQEVRVVAGQTATADFQLTLAPVALEGLVVVGYGTQERRDVTGSIATVEPQQIKDVPTPDPVKALQGRVAGVDIQQSNFDPGAGLQVRIRGVRSMVASNDPLYVVDGIPITGNIQDFDPAGRLCDGDLREPGCQRGRPDHDGGRHSGAGYVDHVRQLFRGAERDQPGRHDERVRVRAREEGSVAQRGPRHLR
jgi:hypothetical protein